MSASIIFISNAVLGTRYTVGCRVQSKSKCDITDKGEFAPIKKAKPSEGGKPLLALMKSSEVK